MRPLGSPPTIAALLALILVPQAGVLGSPQETEPPQTRSTGKPIGKGAAPPVVTLQEPEGGWTVSRMVTVAGTVSDSTVDPVSVSINGSRYLLRTAGGAFRRKFPVTAGKNAVVVEASNRGGTGSAARTLYAQVPPVPVFLVLTSDTDGVYTDLHVYEPPSDATDPEQAGRDRTEHVFWARTTSPSGGSFYLNEQGEDFDQPGYGPYAYTHTSPPLGFYRVDANYWPSGDKAHTVATLDVVLFGGTPEEVRRRLKVPLVAPGETRTLAWLKVEGGGKGRVWVPSVDRRPTDARVWPAWVVEQPDVRMDEAETP